MRRFVVVAFLVLLAFMIAGCCTPPPARLDPKKRAAFLDQTAVIVSAVIAGEKIPAATAQEHNRDAALMTSGGQ